MTVRLYVALAVIGTIALLLILWAVARRARAAAARFEAERERAARNAAPWQMFSRPVLHGSVSHQRYGWAVGIERRTEPDVDPIEQERMQFWPSEPNELERADVGGQAIAKAARYNATRGYSTL